MLRRRLLVKVFTFAALLYGTYCVRRQYVFQKFLEDSKIRFDDFPLEYVRALNDTVARSQQPTDFPYSSIFTETKIPRTIHFIWFENLYQSRLGITEIPSFGSKAPELCQQYNPSYEIRIWNATSARNFLTTEYHWFLPTYDGYRHPIQRVDALKYFVLWHYGGIYMDLDIECRRPLDPLLNFPAWFPEASPLGVNNDLMASIARHPIMGKMTAGLITHNRNLIFPYITIFWTTGPQYTSNIIQEWFEHYGEWGDAERLSRTNTEAGTFFVLPRVFYSEEYTFFGHLPGGTWHGADVAVVLWFINRPWALLSIVATIVAIVVRILRERHCRIFRYGERANFQSV